MDKAKCVLDSRPEGCLRCKQKHIICELPAGQFAQFADMHNTASTKSLQTTDGVQIDALGRRIERVEGLLSGLNSALPASIQANDEDQQFYGPMNDRSLMNTTTVNHLPTADTSGNPGGGNHCFLPPVDEGHALLTEYLHGFNSKVPLLNPEAIYTHMRACYSGSAEGVASSWILTYLVFGIAHQLRALSSVATHNDTPKAEYYLDKCLDSFTRVLLEEPNEKLVQCLLGVAIMLQHSAKSHRVASFISIAMRMAQELGYNEAHISANHDPTQGKVESYLFWICFFMDADLSMYALKPSTHKPTDITIRLPNAHDGDWWPKYPESSFNAKIDPSGINIFFLHSSLAIIQSQALEQVFSVKANMQPTQQSIAVQSITAKLAAWRWNSGLNAVTGLQGSDLLHLAMLEASYFRTVYQLEASRQVGRFTYRQDMFSHIALRSQRHHQQSAVFEDAGRLLSLLASLPADIACLSR
jgi:hypothetical protein